MRLYLDICALKRLFDDQTQPRVITETKAVLKVLARIERGDDTMVWSTAMTIENDADPDDEARLEVARYAALSELSVTLTPSIESRTRQLHAGGLGPLDAAHLAFAEAAQCDALLTCDDRFMRRARSVGTLIRVLNPIECLGELGDHA